MANFDYIETAQDALDVLADVGALTTVTSTPAPAVDDYDPSTGGAAAAPDPVVVTAFGAIFDYTKLDLGNQPDARIRAGDRQLLLAALDVNGAPVPEAALPIDAAVVGPDGAPYIIKGVKPLAPAGVAVLFDINARRPG